ncbi:hypothetical protein HCN44_011372 [Aphidius gifuensis]|uniref:Triokinase/FMN cyclase n=1 Tax=Aphidius gifuensis TaxID=684658 RepID=A0A834XXE6_APHGI|nr:PTS-dependent dihydroxyacetone kinase 1, dihydroxyacetone-binding subunit DhaK-like isoform X2 [Aphidius gifuensis]KAF7994103.1 hypothetical protein HCN44_011372 [Aphidius gifuensis]
MASKKLINSVNNVVDESLSGLCTAYPQLDYHPNKRVVLSSNWNDDKLNDKKIGIICGGGSGHEPFSAGFVGAGMLSASISGDVFAAPPPNNILHAIKCVTGNAGTIVVIPNYTGDCLNFGIAIEKAKQNGLKILDIVVDDDCSIPDDNLGRAGKRGLVGILFVIKIIGGLSKQEMTLETIYNHAKIISNNIATYGVGLSSCSLPGQGKMFQLPDDEIEIGLGVHGEAGYDRIKMKNINEIVEIMLTSINNKLSLKSNDSVAVIINNFGATSQLEQGIVVNEVVIQLKKMSVNPVRIYSGVLMTSLDSAGIHISIFKIPIDNKNLYISCLDDTTDAPSWPGCVYSFPRNKKINYQEDKHQVIKKTGRKLDDNKMEILEECLRSACENIIENEIKLNSLDRGCGDGDCGYTHKKLANGILRSFKTLEIAYPASLLTQLSWIAEECMGGTSGAVYSLFFTTAACSLSKSNEKNDKWDKLLSDAWKFGIDGIMKYSKARPGDRTMLDSLSPAYKIYNENILNNINFKVAIKNSADAARIGCEATKKMIPRAGRAAYVKQSEYFNNVDAGAFGVVVWLNAISDIIENYEN